jgi:hypothetical protein
MANIMNNPIICTDIDKIKQLQKDYDLSFIEAKNLIEYVLNLCNVQDRHYNEPDNIYDHNKVENPVFADIFLKIGLPSFLLLILSFLAYFLEKG